MMSPQAQDIRTFMERTAASSIVQAQLPVETRRAQFEAQRALIPLPPDVQVEAITAGSVAAEWVNTLDLDEQQVVLYIHVGGFVWGSCTSSRVVAATFARVAQARVLVPDYSLAPEHPFPAAPQDCLAAYHRLLDSGVSPEHLVVVGDSAGGSLVLALLVKLAQDELLVDGAIRLTECLRQVGGSVELQIGEGFWHTWPITATMRPFPEGTQALEQIGAFVRAHHTC